MMHCTSFLNEVVLLVINMSHAVNLRGAAAINDTKGISARKTDGGVLAFLVVSASLTVIGFVSNVVESKDLVKMIGDARMRIHRRITRCSSRNLSTQGGSLQPRASASVPGRQPMIGSGREDAA
jgi:hypothetical protein